MSLEKALAYLNKNIKDCSIRPLSKYPNIKVSTISSQSLVLNQLLGRGGWPKGHIIEIHGAENTGKTTLCYHAIAEAQSSNIVCAMVDAEHRVDPAYAASLGVNINELLFTQPSSGEDGLDSIIKMLESGEVGLIVGDSIDAFRPAAEEEGDLGKANVGLHAKLIGQAVRKITSRKGNCCVIFTNQIREKPGMVYGNPEYQPGGRALKFYASVRLELRRGEFIEDADDQRIGNLVKCKVVKNSVAPPFRTGEIKLMYGKGIDRKYDAFQAALSCGVFVKKGSFYKVVFNGQESQIGQGEASVMRWLEQGERLKKLTGVIKKSTTYLEQTGEIETSIGSEPAPDAPVLVDGGEDEGEESSIEV